MSSRLRAPGGRGRYVGADVRVMIAEDKDTFRRAMSDLIAGEDLTDFPCEPSHQKMVNNPFDNPECRPEVKMLV